MESDDYDKILTGVLAIVGLEHNYLIRAESNGIERHIIEKRESKRV